jgi:hypothetical protein
MTQVPDQMPRIPVTGNVIGLVGAVKSKHIRKISAAASKCAIKHGGFRLDFSEVTDIHAPQALPLISLVDQYRQGGADVHVENPKSVSCLNLFQRHGWLDLFSTFTSFPHNLDSVQGIPTLQFRDSDEHFIIVNKVVDHVLSHMPGLSRDHFSAFEWALNEITDNVLSHSKSTLGGLLHLNNFRGHQRVIEYIVCDSGVGIPQTLRTGLPQLTDDVEALTAAIEEGVTRDKTTNAGNGLYGSYRISVVSGGHFEIESGLARLHYSSSNHVSASTGKSRGGLRIDRSATIFPGTMVRASLNYRDQFTLSQALGFSRPYASPTNYVESQYENENGVATIHMKRDWHDYGTRTAGAKFRTKLLNLISISEQHRVLLDMSGIHVLSSSFSDEVFGKLYAEFGSSNFHATISMSNVEETVRHLIDRAIVKRATSMDIQSNVKLGSE